MSEKKYNVILADPPWTYNDKCHAGERGAGYKYDLMTLDQICDMRSFIDSLAAPDCLLAMWHVPPMPAEALRVVTAWGFTLKTFKGFTWHKLTKHSKEHFGMGNWTRANSEDCLFAARGKPKRINMGVRQVIHAPVREHSRKPDEARERLVILMGDVPRIELFARERVEGWDLWGNESENAARFTPATTTALRRDDPNDRQEPPASALTLEQFGHGIMSSGEGPLP
jgi:N6-adenosine-specific RNA methylase IME4